MHIAYFPEDPDSGQRNFLLAQILFELERYDEASAEYLRPLRWRVRTMSATPARS